MRRLFLGRELRWLSASSVAASSRTIWFGPDHPLFAQPVINKDKELDPELIQEFLKKEDLVREQQALIKKLEENRDLVHQQLERFSAEIQHMNKPAREREERLKYTFKDSDKEVLLKLVHVIETAILTGKHGEHSVNLGWDSLSLILMEGLKTYFDVYGISKLEQKRYPEWNAPETYSFIFYIPRDMPRPSIRFEENANIEVAQSGLFKALRFLDEKIQDMFLSIEQKTQKDYEILKKSLFDVLIDENATRSYVIVNYLDSTMPCEPAITKIQQDFQDWRTKTGQGFNFDRIDKTIIAAVQQHPKAIIQTEEEALTKKAKL
jgi:hypothetical protein